MSPEGEQQAREALTSSLTSVLDEIDGRFRIDHAAALEALSGLSTAELSAITPSVTAEADLQALIGVVETGTAKNLSNAELKHRIVGLGGAAVAIARKVKGLASLFV